MLDTETPTTRATVSVVIPSYRRANSLRRCLHALSAQERPADEVLVVARREDAETVEAVRDVDGLPLDIVLVDIPDGHPGVVAALNAGLARSRGEIVCFTDDDAEPKADWIARIASTFAAHPEAGAIGGRDRLYLEDRLQEPSGPLPVGRLTAYGRILGNHHLGIGELREVDVLKGVDLSVRGDPGREIGIDRRLLGTTTEHHWELGLCLRIKQRGFKVLYDPAIAVDHRPEARIGEPRKFGLRQARDAAHNETLALLDYLSFGRTILHLGWATLAGNHRSPGLVRVVTDRAAPRAVAANLRGRSLAIFRHVRT
jgi:GT2 family glycosyltransferase